MNERELKLAVKEAAARGDIKSLVAILQRSDVDAESSIVMVAFGAAAAADEASTVSFLIDAYPSFPEEESALSNIQDQCFTRGRSGLAAWKVLVARYPQISTMPSDRTGDHVGRAVLQNNVEAVRWMLEHGCDVSRARIRFIPILAFITSPDFHSTPPPLSKWLADIGLISRHPDDFSEMVDLLISYNAPTSGPVMIGYT